MQALRSKAPVVLFGYDSSAFTQKVRLALRLKQVPYTFVIVPSMMPRPTLKDNFNITYRKIPVVMFGKEAYIDTSLICEALELKFPQKDGYGTLYPSVSGGGPQRSLVRAMASYCAFGTDRAGLIGHKLDPEKLEKKIPQMMSGLDMHLSLLESLFQEAQGKSDWMLETSQPGLVDIAFFYQLDWGRNIALGYGVEDLTGGKVAEGGEPGAEKIFNAERYPLLNGWYFRTKKYLDDLPTNETRVERHDQDGIAKVVETIKDSALDDAIPLLPTPAPPHKELDEQNGLISGARITIAPVDTGMNDPSVGTLLAATPEEIVIAPEDIEGRHVDLRLHFPRTEFRARPLASSKL